MAPRRDARSGMRRARVRPVRRRGRSAAASSGGDARRAARPQPTSCPSTRARRRRTSNLIRRRGASRAMPAGRVLRQHRPRDAGRRGRARRRARLRPPRRRGARRRRARADGGRNPLLAYPNVVHHAAHRRRDARDARPRASRWSPTRSRGFAAGEPLSTSSTVRRSVSGDLLLAIDAGTGSCRAVLFDLDGTPRRHRPARVTATRPSPACPGSQVFDTAANWELVLRVRARGDRAARRRRGAIAGGGRHQHARGHGAVRRARPGALGLPQRRLARGREAAELVAVGRGGADLPALPATGWRSRRRPASAGSPATRPELFDRVAHVGMLGDWIATRLCGEYATDPSLGSSSGMFDLAARGWSDPSARALRARPRRCSRRCASPAPSSAR